MINQSNDWLDNLYIYLPCNPVQDVVAKNENQVSHVIPGRSWRLLGVPPVIGFEIGESFGTFFLFPFGTRRKISYSF